MSRAVVPGVAHHLTQRGVDRRDVFFSDADREVYIRLAAWSMTKFGVRVLAYCLMTNHVHWVVVPEERQSLGRAFGWLHGRYAQHQNAALARNGHFWQNRFFSCALDEAHTWAAVRYAERNPVRAGLIESAEEWRWSSAGVRTGKTRTPLELDFSAWREQFTLEQWRVVLSAECMSEAEQRLRISTYTGRPLGEESFVARAEAVLKRRLTPSKGGRPRKIAPEHPGQVTQFGGAGA
jgi:putative transposase